ncbi:MAG: ATP synthase subunit I [Syntrophaceae bacterium]|jgi:hypothetical protein|nr:ATP synthase subunit I [Syntrophaceae bacterium]HOC59811.1 ATP synthase subunit I [Smithellaceae bacterium]HQM46068.1 ATP synthase subunit I [Smithellaceae bacterium]
MTNWIILSALALASLFLAPLKFTLGILLGGFVSILNFHGMVRNLHGIFKNPSDNAKRPTMVNFFLRLAATAVVLYFLLTAGTVDVVGLIIGLSVVVINIIFMMLTTLAKKNFIKEVR